MFLFSANVDEYSPIYERAEWKTGGDTYDAGVPGLVAWATLLSVVILGGATAIYLVRATLPRVLLVLALTLSSSTRACSLARRPRRSKSAAVNNGWTAESMRC